MKYKNKKLIFALTMTLTTSVWAPFSNAKTEEIKQVPLVTKEMTIKEVATKKTSGTVAEEVAKQLVNTYGITSVQYALMDKGEIAISGQAGVFSKVENKALTKDTLYGIGSVSKMYTAAAVMKLVELGKLELDKSVVDYMPDFKMVDDKYKMITPRMLLNHTSGIMATGLENALLLGEKDSTPHDIFLELLKEKELKLTPGIVAVYSNDGFTLAELLVETVSGMSFTDFIHTYFTKPLALAHTKTAMDTIDYSTIAKAYIPSYEGELLPEIANVVGAGGVYTTAEELCQFAQLFTGEKKEILSDASTTAMAEKEYEKSLWAPATANSFGFGLGWDSVDLYPFNEYGIKALVKGGDLYTQHASLIVLPEYQMSAAVITSGGTALYNQMVATEMLLAKLEEKGIIKEIKPKKTFKVPTAHPMPEVLKEGSGVYGNYASKISVKIEEDKLSLDLMIPGVPAIDYIYTKEGSFVSQDGSTKVKVMKEKNDRTYLWMEQYMTLPGIGQLALTQYAYEKLPANPLPEKVQEAWEKREGKAYFIISEKPSSEVYLLSPTTMIAQSKELPGYVGSIKIVNEKEAQMDLQIPMIGGRDLLNLELRSENGVEYLTARNGIYIEQAAIQTLEVKEAQKITIGDKGYAQWYNLKETTANKTLVLDLPEGSNVIVYNEKGLVAFSSYLSGDKKVTLPENGLIVFLGEPNTTIGIVNVE